MDADFEIMLRESVKRKTEYMKDFYARYEAYDSEDDVMDLKTLTVIQRKGKTKSLKKFKQKRDLPPRAREFGKMTSYSISIESRKCIMRIKKHIKAMAQSETGSILSYKTEEYEETETTKIIVTKNIVDVTYDDEKRYSPEDCDKTICDENETLPLDCKSDPVLYNPNGTLDPLTCDQASISGKGELFLEFRQSFIYREYFNRKTILAALPENACSLTSKPIIKQQEHSVTNYFESSCKFSSNFSTPKSDGDETLTLKKCSVLLQRIMLPENASAGDKCSNFKPSKKNSTCSQLKFIKDVMSKNPDDDNDMKTPQKKLNLTEKLENVTPVLIRKHLRPRCLNSGLIFSKDCSCIQCTKHKTPSVKEYSRKRFQGKIYSVLRTKKRINYFEKSLKMYSNRPKRDFPSKYNSTPTDGKKHFGQRNTCPSSIFSSDSSKKAISMPQFVKNQFRPEKFTPDTFLSKNSNKHNLSFVKKSCLKDVRHSVNQYCNKQYKARKHNFKESASSICCLSLRSFSTPLMVALKRTPKRQKLEHDCSVDSLSLLY